MTAKKKATAKVKTASKAAAKSPKAAAPKKTKPSTKAAAVKSAAVTKAAVSAATKAIAQKQSKSQIYAAIAETAQMNKNEVKAVISAIRSVIERHVKPKGSGEVTLHDLGIKVRRVQKKATKARMGRNPLTGEDIKIAAKPARKSVKVSALKTLKELIAD